MNYVFLSPHLDDAVFSCGGLLYTLVQTGHSVEVWSFATRDPDLSNLSSYARSLHIRWQEWDNPSRVRRDEDQRALSLLGCTWQYLGYLDCIYRQNPITGDPITQSDNDLFDPNIPVEEALIQEMHHELQNRFPAEESILVTPLAVGNHIDHRNVRLTAERLTSTLYYYADFPYAAQFPDQIDLLLPNHPVGLSFDLFEEAINKWQNAVTCYASQISTFWSSIDTMKIAISDYARQSYARTLCKSDPSNRI